MSHYEFWSQIALAWLLSEDENSSKNIWTCTISDISAATPSSNKSRRVSGYHHWILIMALFACSCMMMTSIFPYSAPTKDLAVAYVVWSKKRKIPKIALELLLVINATFPSASMASNLSIQRHLYLSYDQIFWKTNWPKKDKKWCHVAIIWVDKGMANNGDDGHN